MITVLVKKMVTIILFKKSIHKDRLNIKELILMEQYPV